MSENKVELTKMGGQRCLKFNFGSNLTAELAESLIKDWARHFNDYPNEKFVLIWDCLQMSGYEPGARMKWQKAMKDFTNQIDVVWIIADKNIIILGAKLMNMISKLNLKVVSSLKEIPVKEPALSEYQ